MLSNLIAYLNQDPLAALIALASLLIGLTGGLGLAACLLFWDCCQGPDRKKHQPRKQLNPRQHKKETERRARLNAVMMVETGAITQPTRR